MPLVSSVQSRRFDCGRPSVRSLCVALFFGVALAANGYASTFLAKGYTLRVWQTEDGLPQNLVNSTVQTRDGYLWFGTNNGLARFDGEQFQVFDAANTPQIQDRRISQLFEDAQGTLWIGQESGGITRLREGRFEVVYTPNGKSGEKIFGLGSDEAGRMWAMHESGAVRSLGEDLVLPSMLVDEPPGIMGWNRGPDGRIWLIENYHPFRLDDARLVPVELPPPHHNNFVDAFAAASKGGIWTIGYGRIRRLENGRWAEDLGPRPGPEETISQFLELQDGTLVIGTIRSGLYLVFADGRPTVHLDSDDGLPQNWVRSLYQDREGTLWVGAGSFGLVSIRPSAFSFLEAPDKWSGCSTLALAAGRDNALWIGTEGAGLYRHASGDWQRYKAVEQFFNPYISAVTESRSGDVWVGNYWQGGPYRLDGGQFVRPVGVHETTSPVLALIARPDRGDVLVGTRDGLSALGADGFSRLISSPRGTGDDVCAVAQDSAGAIWCGFSQGGLALRTNDGVVKYYTREDGLGSNSVQSLFTDDDGSLWIGTADNGLTRFKDGRFDYVTKSQGLIDNTICHIEKDDNGYFWLSTHHGIQRVAVVELNRCADGAISVLETQSFDRSDGLPVSEFLGGRQGAGCRTEDGRIWFASSVGPVSVDPDLIQPNPLPPPMALESLVVDSQPVAFEEGAVSSALAPDHERLEFRFSALSFVAPEKVKFKYRLEGSDKDWRDAGAMRFAQYSRLPAGEYRFRVVACNNDGVWNNEGVSLAFAVAPFFWETWWFVGACALAIVAWVAMTARYVTRRRMQRKMKDMERRHAVERERSRIAQDIHDDVGASLSRIAILSQTARSQFAESAPAVAVLSNIYGTARSVTRSLDEIVWAVNPKHDTLDSLVDYMGKYAHDFMSAANLRCRLDLPVEVPPWPLSAEVRHNLFLAFKEALNNVVKHASASEARVSVEVLPGGFVISLEDDGRGLPEADATVEGYDGPGFGNGLINMQERLARIGGRCEIASPQGSGTKVTFILDVAKSGSRSRG